MECLGVTLGASVYVTRKYSRIERWSGGCPGHIVHTNSPHAHTPCTTSRRNLPTYSHSSLSLSLSLSLVFSLSRVPFPVTCSTPRPRGEDARLGGAGPEKGILGEEGGEEAEGEGKVEVATGHDRFSVGNPMVDGEEEPGTAARGEHGGREGKRREGVKGKLKVKRKGVREGGANECAVVSLSLSLSLSLYVPVSVSLSLSLLLPRPSLLNHHAHMIHAAMSTTHMKMKCRRVGTVKAIHAETKGRMTGPMTMRPSQKNLPVPCHCCEEGAVATRERSNRRVEGRGVQMRGER